MPPRRRFGKRLIKSLLPIVLVIGLAVIASLSFIVYCVTRPQRRPYVVTPESFARISGRALKVTDETWTNRDGRPARGWLLKGAEGAPAVVLLHRYGGELGAYSALKAASQDNRIKVLVLDSIVNSPDELLNDAVSHCVAIDNSF